MSDNKPQKELKSTKPDSSTSKSQRKRKYDRNIMRVKQVSHLKLHKKLMTILNREVDNLMVLSARGLLTDKQSASLVNYLKLEQKLLEFEDNIDKQYTDDELNRIANKHILNTNIKKP